MWLAAVLAAGFVISFLFHRRASSLRVPLALALLLCVGPLVLVQRVIPFERVWLFALPLYFIGAAAGLAMTLEPLLDRLRWRSAIVLIAVVVALFAGQRVERSGSVYISNESRGLPAVAVWLKGHLTSGDSVIASASSDAPLRYYLRNEGVSISYLGVPNRKDLAPHRMFVVLNEVAGDTVREFWKRLDDRIGIVRGRSFSCAMRRQRYTQCQKTRVCLGQFLQFPNRACFPFKRSHCDHPSRSPIPAQTGDGREQVCRILT